LKSDDKAFSEILMRDVQASHRQAPQDVPQLAESIAFPGASHCRQRSIDWHKKEGREFPALKSQWMEVENRLSTIGRAKLREGSPTGAMLTKQN
jgi:hypothetical protein